ncbi:MAG: hypothetical protein QF685_09625 [Verrucomicrobiota bacterium]|jgi:hypothetical protein|nr:hypothetical protein [Verrucomicrobiota bacterium]
MRINRKKIGWIVGALALILVGVVPVCGADGDPDAKQDVRDAAVVEKLKDHKQVSLLYVKGMT